MELETEIVTCGRCSGIGWTKIDRKQTDCPGCGSSGYIRVNKPAKTCGRCSGIGWIKKDRKQVDCPGCNSSGYFRG